VTLGAADERAHSTGESSWWWEAWHLDAATEDGVGVAVRLACAPALGVAWWWTHVLLPGLPGPIVVRDHEVGLPRQGLEVRADGLWGELWCASPFEHWTYSLEAFGVKLDDPADSLHGEIGERMPVGLDIEWEADPNGSTAHEHRADDRIRGYEQFGVVHGELLLDRTRLELDAIGLRSHTWGAPRTDRAAYSLWLHSEARSLSFTVSDGAEVDGYVAHHGGVEQRISSVRTETRLRADGLPVAARHIVDDDLALDVEVLGLSAVPLTGPGGERATLARALCAEGAPGRRVGAGEIGWSSWLVPE
jgi:hypothetical protein